MACIPEHQQPTHCDFPSTHVPCNQAARLFGGPYDTSEQRDPSSIRVHRSVSFHLCSLRPSFFLWPNQSTEYHRHHLLLPLAGKFDFGLGADVQRLPAYTGKRTPESILMAGEIEQK
jgi:hypothetical protein